ncbi:hypothetical protein AGABI1DRAFT_111814 [Agaricus bisporus var. burnettii JB137-S8]|uniref:Hydrophobin n=2 Tax=Agaricus bisporus var. burnettii TaxID=192524 RepID=K5XE93_AGABU|nr:uncharacterized protein AGABI1DRAFT_111814 [Agaricus bisporus var. burnettii JB137-S8]EKM81507.1 hypothetical protein AGABI1DRAFT_111814 [Agaricus bisporus var. burnettii JB137-S8]KAF7770842.1 fungal hydrophobin [Agaricus bisporus var. burnettii]
MFARVSAVFNVLFFVMLAAASAVPRTTPPQCNGGTIQCCNALYEVTSPIIGIVANPLGILLGPFDGLVGIFCTPVDIIGGGNSCSQQAACCTGTSYGDGVIITRCSPITLDV